MSGALSHLPSNIIRQLLVDLGVGSLPTDNISNPISIENEPNSPDNVITIYTTTSVLQGRNQNNGEMNEFYGIQIRIRNSDIQNGWIKAKKIQNEIDTVVNRNTVSIADTTGTSTSSYLVHAITRTSGILSIGKEGQESRGGRTDRNLFTINAIVSITETA